MNDLTPTYINFKRFLDDVDEYLEYQPHAIIDQAPAGLQLEIPQLLRRGIALGLFNRVEGLASELAEDFCRAVNQSHISKDDCQNNLWEKSQSQFAAAMSRKFYEPSWDVTEYNSTIASTMVESTSNDVIRVSHHSFYTDSNVSWDDLTRTLKFFRLTATRGITQGFPTFNHLFKTLINDIDEEWFPLGYPGAGGSDDLPRRIWVAFADARHDAAHSHDRAPELNILKLLAKYARVSGEALTLYHALLKMRLSDNHLDEVYTSSDFQYCGNLLLTLADRPLAKSDGSVPPFEFRTGEIIRTP